MFFLKKSGLKICQFKKKALPLHSHLEKCLPKGMKKAEIAQLVEHNLAKVGVAGPSPVFRSHAEQKRDIKSWF